MTSLHSRCWEKSLLSLSLGFWEEAMMPLPVLLGLVPGSGEAEVDGDAVLVYWLLVSSSFSLLSCPSPFFGFFSLFFLLHVLVFLFFTFYCFVSCPLCFLFLSFCSTLPLFPAFFPLLCLVPSCFLPSSSRLLSVFIFFFSRSLLLCSPCFLSRSFLLFSLLLLSRSSPVPPPLFVFFLSGAADARALAGSAALCFFCSPCSPCVFFSFFFLPSSPPVFLLSSLSHLSPFRPPFCPSFLWLL